MRAAPPGSLTPRSAISWVRPAIMLWASVEAMLTLEDRAVMWLAVWVVRVVDR